MLPLPDFDLLIPDSLDQAVQMLAEHRGHARVVAGGTDLLVNMKHRFVDARTLIHLKGVAELKQITQRPDGTLALGAGVTLSTVRDHPLVRRALPALSLAAGMVASPQIQNMGTLGGNVCLDTRCVYINQTHFWRQALGHCLKKDGTMCHVVKGGQLCVAAQSSDTVPVLINHGATLEIVGSGGMRTLPVEELYKKDGAQHLTLADDELVARIVAPPSPPGLRSTYVKHRTRRSIDFPVLSFAVAVELDADGVCRDVRVAATCINSRPRAIKRLHRLAVGKPLDDAVIAEVAQECGRQLNPLDNIMVDPAWRKAMIPVMVERALRDLRDQEN